jgi:hypothetical protein
VKLHLVLAAAAVLGACSPEPARSPDAASPFAATPPTAAAPTRTAVLKDPSSAQLAALVADWTGQPLDLEGLAERSPEYLNVPASERPATLARLTETARSVAQGARNVGVLDLTVPVGSVTFVPETQVYHLPIFLPGGSIELAPSHRLRLSNAEAAYALSMNTAAAQAMTAAKIRPARVRLTTRIDQVRPTQYGAEVTGTLQTFTLYDEAGRPLGESVSMTAG